MGLATYLIINSDRLYITYNPIAGGTVPGQTVATSDRNSAMQFTFNDAKAICEHNPGYFAIHEKVAKHHSRNNTVDLYVNFTPVVHSDKEIEIADDLSDLVGPTEYPLVRVYLKNGIVSEYPVDSAEKGREHAYEIAQTGYRMSPISSADMTYWPAHEIKKVVVTGAAESKYRSTERGT